MQDLRNEAYCWVRRNDERCRITPRLRFLRTHSGFSYIGVLLAVAIAGMPFQPDRDYLAAEQPQEIADQIKRLLADPSLAANLDEI